MTTEESTSDDDGRFSVNENGKLEKNDDQEADFEENLTFDG
jgi:hypothetical protein